MFQEAVINSFRKVKADVISLKKNLSEWIVFYNMKHADHEKRIEFLEQRIIFLEKRELQKRW